MHRWCTPQCPHAEWPEDAALDGSRSCRTFIALRCTLHDRLVAKNAPCLGDAPAKRKRGASRSHPPEK